MNLQERDEFESQYPGRPLPSRGTGDIPLGGGPYSHDVPPAPPAPPPRGGGPYSDDLPVTPPSRAYGTSPYEGPTGSPYATGPDPTPYYPPTADRLPPPPAEDFGPPPPTGTNDLTPEQAQQMQLDIDRGRMMHRLNEERAREFASPDPPPFLRSPMPAPPMGPKQSFYYPGAAVNPLMALPRTTVGSQDLYSMYGIPFR